MKNPVIVVNFVILPYTNENNIKQELQIFITHGQNSVSIYFVENNILSNC